jgi:hypothetical protein
LFRASAESRIAASEEADRTRPRKSASSQVARSAALGRIDPEAFEEAVRDCPRLPSISLRQARSNEDIGIGKKALGYARALTEELPDRRRLREGKLGEPAVDRGVEIELSLLRQSACERGAAKILASSRASASRGEPEAIHSSEAAMLSEAIPVASARNHTGSSSADWA